MTKRITILLSTYQGERFLDEQLSSIACQTHDNWTLMWRDDGSSDRTLCCLKTFSAKHPGRVIQVDTKTGNLGAAESFMYLLSKAPEDGLFSFCDQDDVWLPDKLSRSIDALRAIPDDVPALYCTRQYLVDENLKPIGCSQKLKRPPSFQNALVQNIAAGCTIVMNIQARSVILSAKMPQNSMHDWWAYLTVTAAGGKIIFDNEPSLLYRQHEANTIGHPGGIISRALSKIRRGPEPFWRIFDAHLNALENLSSLASDARRTTAILRKLQYVSSLKRLYYLSKARLYRQGMIEDLALRIFVLFKKKPIDSAKGQRQESPYDPC